MTVVTGGSGPTLHPWGPYGASFWGGYWAPTPSTGPGVSDLTGTIGITARALGYDALQLQWQEPAQAYDYLVIVRSSYGYPVTPTEGTVVLGGAPGTFGSNITIDSPLGGGRFYYYSLFIRVVAATPQWQQVGRCVGLVPKNNASGKWLFESLPEYYQEEDSKTALRPIDGIDGQWGQLRRFLEVIGQEHDTTRTMASSLFDAFNARLVRADLLQYLAATVGFPFEPHIGYQQQRRLMENWFAILKQKGTIPGIKLFVESLTGYQTIVSRGINMLNSPEDSEGKGGIGLWRSDQSSIINAAATCVVASLTAVTPASPFSTTCTTALQVVTDSNGSHEPFLIDADVSSPSAVMRTATHVSPSTSYSVAAAFRAVSAIMDTPAIYIYFYDANGVFISFTFANGNAYNNSAWTTSSASFTTPANAAYVAFIVSLAPGTSKTVLYTAVQMKPGASIVAYQPARQVQISCAPQRVNYFPNPSFEGTTSNHVSSVDGTAVRSTDTAYYGTHSLKASIDGQPGGASSALTFGAMGDGAGIDTMPVDPFHPFPIGDTWSFRMAIKGAQASIGEALEFHILKAGPSHSVQEIFPVSLAGESWTYVGFDTTISRQDISNAINSIIVQMTWIGIPDGTTLDYYFDAISVEKNSLPSAFSYFDGSSDLTSRDFAWLGEVNNSASVYYPNRLIRDERLQALLPDYLPFECPFAVQYALP